PPAPPARAAAAGFAPLDTGPAPDGGPGQAHLYIGQRTIPRSHPDRIALEVVGVALGAGAGLIGRLPTRIREEAGLAYAVDVATAAGAGLDDGRLAIYAGTSPDAIAEVEGMVREELTQLCDDGPRGGLDDGAFETARGYLLGRLPFQRETARQWTQLIADATLYGVPFDQPGWTEAQLRALTRADAEAAARRWLQPDTLCVTVGVALPPGMRADDGAPAAAASS
ncbi:MAG: insulinase family protein, partial [Acidobacteriota bacterium]